MRVKITNGSVRFKGRLHSLDEEIEVNEADAQRLINGSWAVAIDLGNPEMSKKPRGRPPKP